MDENSSLYEVRCLNCETSFPVGTRRCIHCGSRIGRAPGRTRGRRREAPAPPHPLTPVRGAPASRAPSSTGAAIDPEAFLEEGREEDETEETGGPLRISLWALSVGLALMGSLFRVCQAG